MWVGLVSRDQIYSEGSQFAPVQPLVAEALPERELYGVRAGQVAHRERANRSYGREAR